MKIGVIRFLLVTLLVVLIVSPESILAKEYPPELSGNLDIGDRVQLEGEGTEPGEEVSELDFYQRYWLKYKQKLNPADYYYYKIQYYRKEYKNEIRYNNYTLDLWGNYTYRLSDSLRNHWLVNLRNKDYNWNDKSNYLQLRLKYQLDFTYNQQHDYSLYLQREYQNYQLNREKDNLYDRVSLSWGYKVNKELKFKTRLELNREQSLGDTKKSKNGRKLSVGFNWKMDN